MSNRPGTSTIPTPSSAAAAIMTKSKIDFVQIDALVVLKLVKYCHELNGGSDIAQGILTGMVQSLDNSAKKIEVTNCFPLPNLNSFKESTDADYDESI